MKTKKKYFKGKQSSSRTTVTLTASTGKWSIGINREIVKRLGKIGDMMKKFFFHALTGPRTGNVYWVPELNSYYTASATHEYPAEKLGLLRKSLRYRTGMSKEGPFLAIGVLGEAVRYAKELENPSSGIYRPFLRRGMIENEDVIKKMLKEPYVL